MNISAKATVGIIGSGTMGTGIAQVAATAGHDTLIFDSDPGALKKAGVELLKTLSRLVEKNKITSEESNGIAGRTMYVDALSKLSSCNLIIEAVVENAEVKQKLFRDLENIVGQDCILASNTSSLSITSIASGCNKPERVIGLHFFNPASIMPLVEVVPGLSTDSVTIDKSKEIIGQWNKTVVLAKDTPGFIVNRIARPFYGESIRILEEGWGGIPDGKEGIATIDWAMKEFGGFKMGPFELMDMIGNDVNYTVTETVWTQFFYDQRYKPSLTQKRLFEAKHFGRKSGRGYYTYGENVVAPQPMKNKEAGEKIFMRVLAMLINEAADALYYRIATREDIDLAMTKGVNYPKGLLKWSDDSGADKMVEVLESLRVEYQEERYRPSVLLKQMANKKTKFYN